MIYHSRSDVEGMFKYHPPTTEERKQKHNDINKAALDFALIVYDSLKDPTLQSEAIDAIQYARMKANQLVTYEDVYVRLNK